MQVGKALRTVDEMSPKWYYSYGQKLLWRTAMPHTVFEQQWKRYKGNDPPTPDGVSRHASREVLRAALHEHFLAAGNLGDSPDGISNPTGKAKEVVVDDEEYQALLTAGGSIRRRQ